MRRTLLSLLFVILAAATADVRAADSHGAAPAGSQASAAAPAGPAPDQDDAPPGDAAPSPWEHPLWHNATTMMRVYVCEHARRRPSWCDGPRELPANAALPEPQGPPLAEEDARWLAFLDQADPADLDAEEIALVRQRASVRRDPQAMEILAYLYAEGLSLPRDYAEAYRWYGLAFLSGEKRVRPNMDVVWQQLQRHDLEAAMALTREFDAVAAGEVPASMLPPAEEPVEKSAETPGASAAADSGAKPPAP
ncbi:SEL1-like repeat protein [Pelagibius sp. 7325]|uniref:SEL1-like repeat protein n=1 Tax=Pelagibius sp. 7325 TaxID=3131994 RepID=UPI0030EE06D3